MIHINSYKSPVLVSTAQIGLATINDYCAPTKPNRAQRAQNLAYEVIPRWRKEGIHIIGSQETFDEAEIIPDASGYPYHWLEKSKPWWHVKPSGLALLSEYPILARHFRRFGRTTDVTRFSTAGIQVAHVMHPELGIIRVANTHMQSSFDPRDPTQNDAVRLSQAKKDIKPFLTPTFSGSGLFLIMGDLNHHPTNPHTGFVAPEYDFLVHALGLADATRALAEHQGIPREALFTFGPGIYCAEQDYAAAGFKLFFDRIHIGTTHPNHRVVVNLDQSRLQFEDTHCSDHLGVKTWLSLSVYDLGPDAPCALGPRVFFTSSARARLPLFEIGAHRLVA